MAIRNVVVGRIGVSGQTVEDRGEPNPSLAGLKGDKIRAAGKILASKIAQGYAHSDGHTYQLAADALGTSGMFNINAKSTEALASIMDAVTYPWPAGFEFRSAANVMVAMTAVQMFAMGRGAATYVTAARKRFWDLSASIVTAANQTALDAIDITTGWP